MTTMKKHCILIVDDNRISKRITSAFLGSIGASFEDVSSSADAIEKAKNDKYTAIFMNVVLPKMNGLQATKEIRKFNKDIFIYAITSDHIDEMTEEMKDAGFTNVVSKPYNKEFVVKLLSKSNETLPIFDHKQFEQTFKDKELQQDIIDTFLNEEVNDTQRLMTAFETKDNDKIYGAIHYMKGSFTYLKASKILELTQQMLDHLKQDDVTFSLQNKDLFLNLYKELIELLKKV